MRLLRSHHIVKLVEVVDTFFPRESPNPKGGRPVILHQNEVVALLVFSCLVAPQRTLKGVHTLAQTFYYRRFQIPTYKSWVRKCHQALPQMCFMLDQLLDKDTPIRFMDSTMLEVCRMVRADRHRVAKGVADFGRNWQGWHYGFKLHASCSPTGRLCAIWFTPANEHDAQQIPHLVNDATVIAIGDGTYGARIMREKMWREHKAFILAPPHPKQKKKVMAQWQHLLLRARPKIECTFDYLKEHLYLQTSFPRSVVGYFVHYIRILLSYQLMWGF